MVECDTFRSRRFFLPRKRSTSNLQASANTSADSEDSPCCNKAQRAANNKRRRFHPSSIPKMPAASARASVSIRDRPSRTSTRTCLRINQLPWHAKANANGPMMAFRAFETASLLTEVDLYKNRERSSSSGGGGHPPGGAEGGDNRTACICASASATPSTSATPSCAIQRTSLAETLSVCNNLSQ